MLRKIAIQNYAIIEELVINLSGKLNIITGETGAGKSIVVGALGLILGERADSSVFPGQQEGREKKCIVEAIFSIAGKKGVNEFLEENELDADEELFVRREITANGKSRAFINDTPVNLSQLKQLSSLLVDLHQQFDSLEIGESDFQRQVLDALAGHTALIAEYRDVFLKWQQHAKEWEALKQAKQQFEREADYNKFQFRELEEAGFKENELENADAALKMLGNAEAIKEALQKIYHELKGSDQPVVQQLKDLMNQLTGYIKVSPELEALLQRLATVQIELKDIADEADHISNHVNYDPEKTEQLTERLSLGYRLQKKHGVNSTNELITIQQELEEKLKEVLHIDFQIQESEKESGKLRDKVTALAARIADGRKKQVKPLEDKVNRLLSQVGMPNAKLKVEIKNSEPSLSGADHVDFLFDANLPAGKSATSGQFQPLRKVASGGELSRLMLCIKSLVAESIDLPTLIFDEIDTGISGEAARQVGAIIKELAAKRQVVCITHQPQIAGKADAHFFVYKEVIKDSVKTNIRLLNTAERITVIAKMLSGEKPTAAAIENAREMVGN